MGRKPGVSADQTRSQLIDAAALVFAQKGYDGASIADITAAAGLSSGAIYAHYEGKAELFVAVVRARSAQEFTNLLGLPDLVGLEDLPTAAGGVADVLTLFGSSYVDQETAEADLTVEVVVASKRHAKIHELINMWLVEGEDAFTAAISEAQNDGQIDSAISPSALSRFGTMVALGARLTNTLDMPAVDREAWSDLITRLVDALSQPPDTAT